MVPQCDIWQKKRKCSYVERRESPLVQQQLHHPLNHNTDVWHWEHSSGCICICIKHHCSALALWSYARWTFFLQWEITLNISKLWKKVLFSTQIYQLLMQMKFYMYLYQCTPWLTYGIETSVASGVIFCIQFCCFVDALATAVQAYQAFMWCAKVLIGLMGHIEDTF